MKYYLQIAAGFAAIFAVCGGIAACTNGKFEESESQQLAERSEKAEVFIIKDGCTIYRYKSGMHRVYWAKCDGNVSAVTIP